jgi:hypothetical protein
VSQDLTNLTGQLIDVIQMIQLSRGTCQLKVKRGKGATEEEAYLAFVNGQLIEARVGQQTGVEAFNRVSVWRECLVAFISSNQANVASPVISLQDNDRKRDERPVKSPDTPIPQFLPISPLRRRSGSLEEGKTNIQGRGSSMTSFSSLAVPVVMKPINISLRIIEQKGFSRVHRQLLLLVDGKRTCADLVRLTMRKPEEIEKVMRDLEQDNIIRVLDNM